MEFDRRPNLVEHVADWCTQLNKPFLPSDIKESQQAQSELDGSNTTAISMESEGDGKIYRYQ